MRTISWHEARWLVDSAQMRGIEQAEIDAGRVAGLTLMERAGRGVLAAIFEHRPDLAAAPQRALVLCGPGNNGGDGYVIARLLAARGWQVRVLALAPPGPSAPDAAHNARRWLETGTVEPLDDTMADPQGPGPLDVPAAGTGPEAMAAGTGLHGTAVVVDSLFGTGLVRPLEATLARKLRKLAQDARAAGALCVAVDAPSGLCLDSGRALVAGPDATLPLPADLTASFHAPKLGHCLQDGPAACGRLALVDIGLPREVPAPRGAVRLVRPAPRLLAKPVQAHKYRHGHLLVLGGGVGRGGAARLAARAALRAGSGLVTLACPPAAMIENATRLDAVMLSPLRDAAALHAALAADPRLGALCLGPGLGLGPEQAAMVEVALRSGRPAVLDADALRLVAGDRALAGALHAQVVLTPHDGEFSALFPASAAALAARPGSGPAMSRVDAARQAAAQSGAVVLLKGPDTVIAAPDGRTMLHAAVYDNAAPWLATAGAGDVLAGLVAGLMVRGLSPPDAAAQAAWLHAACARRFGPGLIAEDLAEMLPAVLRDLGL